MTGLSSLERKVAERRQKAAGGAVPSSTVTTEQVLPVHSAEALLQQAPGHKQDEDSIVIQIAAIEIPETQSRTPDNPGCSPESLQLLAEDIRDNGQDTSITVIAMDAGGYRLHTGWRRLTAKHLLIEQFPTEMQHRTIRATLKSFDNAAHEHFRHVAENLQRENLTPLEEAAAYKRIKDEYGFSDEQLSAKVKRSRVHVTRLLQLLKLPADLQALIRHNVVGYRAVLKKKGRAVAEYMDTLPVPIQEQISEGGLSLETVLSDPSILDELKNSEGAGELDSAAVSTETTAKSPVKKSRSPKVSIPLESATAICDLLTLLCEQYGISPIELTKQKGKYLRKDLLAVLEARASDVLRAARDESKS